MLFLIDLLATYLHFICPPLLTPLLILLTLLVVYLLPPLRAPTEEHCVSAMRELLCAMSQRSAPLMRESACARCAMLRARRDAMRAVSRAVRYLLFDIY